MKNSNYAQVTKVILNKQGLQQFQSNDDYVVAVKDSHENLLEHLKDGINLLEKMNFTFPDTKTLEQFQAWQSLSRKLVE